MAMAKLRCVYIYIYPKGFIFKSNEDYVQPCQLCQVKRKSKYGRVLAERATNVFIYIRNRMVKVFRLAIGRFDLSLFIVVSILILGSAYRFHFGLCGLAVFADWGEQDLLERERKKQTNHTSLYDREEDRHVTQSVFLSNSIGSWFSLACKNLFFKSKQKIRPPSGREKTSSGFWGNCTAPQKIIKSSSLVLYQKHTFICIYFFFLISIFNDDDDDRAPEMIYGPCESSTMVTATASFSTRRSIRLWRKRNQKTNRMTDRKSSTTPTITRALSAVFMCNAHLFI